MTFSPIMPAALLVVVCLALVGLAVFRLVWADRTSTRWHWAARIAMVVLVFVMALRPTIAEDTAPNAAEGDVDVFFVVDTTSSMAAEDWGDGEPRLDGVRSDVAELVEGLAGARFSLITFDAVTVQRVPLTTDASALDQSVAALSQEITSYSSGSSISAPVEKLEEILTDDESEGRTRIVYYLGDGEQTSDDEVGSFASLAEDVEGGAVLGYGTEQGGRMKEYLGYDAEADGADEGYIQDPSTGDDAVSRIDEGNLGTIADQMGVQYIHRDADTGVDAVLDGITVGGFDDAEQEVSDTPELYWVFAVPFGLLALTELWGLVAALRETRRMKEATDA